jgi:hypothetical protein
VKCKPLGDNFGTARLKVWPKSGSLNASAVMQQVRFYIFATAKKTAKSIARRITPPDKI